MTRIPCVSPPRCATILRPPLFAALLACLVPGITAAGSPPVAGGDASASSFVVEEAWIRAAPPGAAVLAAYATLRNTGARAIEVTVCPTDGIGDVSLHETLVADGMSRMRPLQGVTLGAHGTVLLQPGGMHLMLTDPASQPGTGAVVELCLAVDGVEMLVPFTVRRGAPGEGAHRHH